MQAAEQLEPCLRPDGRLGHITSWAAKLTGTTARIAGLLHGAAHHDGAYRYPVSGDTMNRAIRLGDYLTDHALAVFDLMDAYPATDDAHAVFEWLRGRAGRSSPSPVFRTVTRQALDGWAFAGVLTCGFRS